MTIRSALALAAALAAAPAAAAAAADPWDGPPFAADPATLLAAADALPDQKAAAVDVLLEEGTWRFDARGAATFTYRLVFRPYLPDAARRWARIERSWAPWHQARPEVRARVIGPDGSVHELDPKTLAEVGVGEDGEVYSDRRVLAGPLPGVRPGAIVEEVSTIRDTAPLFDGGVAMRFWLAQPNPVRRSRLRIEAPEALPLRWVVRGGDVAAPMVRVEDGVRTVLFERRDVEAVAPAEPSGPRDVAHAPVVIFGWGRSWGDVAERYGALWQARLGKEPLPEAARAAVRGAAGAEAIRRAAAWIHEHVRYTGLELGEAELVPAAPAETVKRRYGDCKDLSLLLVAMLREAGLDARLALLRTEWQDLAPELPGLGQFDHAIVRVEGTEPLWVDPTDPFTAPGRLPPQDEGRLALVTGPGRGELVRTPESAAHENTGETVRELRLAELGAGRVVETRTLTGALAAAERAFRARVPPDDREDLDRSHARDVFRADVFLGAQVAGEGDLSAPLRIRVEADGSDVVETGDDLAEIPVSPDPAFAPLPAALRGADVEGAPAGRRPRRTTDVVLLLPYRWEVAYRIVPPEGFRMRQPLPADRVERFGPASFAQQYAAAKDGSVSATFRFDTGGRRIPADAADALGRRVRELLQGRSPTVAFERTAAALLAEGKVQDGLAEIRRLVRLHPREAMHRLHLAIALLQLGFAEEAAAEARRGIALEPERAWGHRVLGYVLEHDPVGRFHGPGFDRAGALAAYEVAKAKDPTHAGGRAALAELLAHDASGQRHGAGADLARAVEEYAAVHDELGTREFDEGYLAALFSAGRHADALRLARTMPAGGQRNGFLVAAAAVVEGGERGEEAAAALGEGRRDALRDAAALLVRQRRHPLAAALASAAAHGAPNAAELSAQAETFAAMRPWEKLAEGGDEAERLVRRLLVAAVRAPELAKELAAIALPRALEGDGARILERGLPLPAGVARAALRDTALPPDVLLDLVLSRLETVTSGDPAGGLRVRLRFPFAPAAHGSAVYLARDGGALRLAATDAAWPLLGVEARRRAEAGDAWTAARWLDWAREAVPGTPGDPSTPAGVLAALWHGTIDSPADARRAGAALAAFADARGTTVTLLRSARAGTRDPAERRALAHALAQALRQSGDAAGTLRLADELLADDAGSRAAFALKAWALRRLGRGGAIGPAAEALLARAPEDAAALSLVGSSWLLAGDLDQATRTFRRAIDGGKAPPSVYNDAAWVELFREPVGALALDWARRAVEQGQGRDEAALNTLAAAYGAFGKPAEAREIFLRSLEGGRPLASSDWYVFGLLAEAWGVPEAARAAYARAEARPEAGPGRSPAAEEDPTGAHLLARRRLGKLGGSAGEAPGKAPAATR